MDDNNLSFKIILGNPEIFIPKISILKLFLISEISVFPVFRSDRVFSLTFRKTASRTPDFT